MSNKPVIGALKQVLADSYALYIKTQNYHWNVTGPQFNSLHLLFQTQYEDLALAIDTIAERIRALGEKAPGAFSLYSKMTTIKEGNENAKATQMVKELAADQEKVSVSLKKLLAAAQKAEDDVSVDLAIGRLNIHDKNAWMLRVTLEA